MSLSVALILARRPLNVLRDAVAERPVAERVLDEVDDHVLAANADARLLEDQDRGLKSERGQAARVALYLFERDAAVGLLRAG